MPNETTTCIEVQPTKTVDKNTECSAEFSIMPFFIIGLFAFGFFACLMIKQANKDFQDEVNASPRIRDE